jgi:tetratricopeptide (TPR) repeat protein
LYLYLPSFGLVLVAAVWFSRIRFTPWRVATAGAITLAFCLGTRSNLRIWQNDISLFRRAVRTAPRNPYAKNKLADAYLKAHRESEAFPLLKEVIALNPGYRLGYYNMGRYYQQTGDYVEAEYYFSISDQVYYSQQSEPRLR